MFPSSGSCQAPEGSAISMVSLLDALEKTSLKDILFNTDKEDWDAESLLEDLIESGGLVDFIECGNEDVVNRDVVNALFDVLINCMDQGIVYGSYRSLAFVLSYQDKEWVPDIKGFVEYLKRIGYRREGPVVDWEEMESKESGMGCLQCPITTGRVQLYLRLLSVATESNPVKFSSCHHVQCIVELFCMLVHLFLDVSGESYETDLIQALSGLVSVIGTKEFENMIGVIVDELTELGPTHRSQVHLLRANWSQQLEVQALQRLWGLNALKKILPKEVRSGPTNFILSTPIEKGKSDWLYLSEIFFHTIIVLRSYWDSRFMPNLACIFLVRPHYPVLMNLKYPAHSWRNLG